MIWKNTKICMQLKRERLMEEIEEDSAFTPKINVFVKPTFNIKSILKKQNVP